MPTTFRELLGEELLQYNEIDKEFDQISTSQLNGKTVVLYFSAQWCPSCRNFTPKLSELFKRVENEVEDNLEIVFISCDKDQDTFEKYFKEMPWKALPFSDRDRSKTLSERFNVDSIPSVVVLSPSCEIITSNGTSEITAAYDRAFRQWLEGKSVFWSRKAHEGEDVWQDITCTGCYMQPLIGLRYGCINQECDIDLCEQCLLKNTHEHPLVEYLLPRKTYSLEGLFQSVPYLLNPNSEEKIETKTLWEDDVKSVGVYFSAHWCPPCRLFSPKLAELYKEVRKTSQSFRLVFVSYDEDETSFNECRSTMSWPAVPLNSGAVFKTYFQVSDFPSLFVGSSNGRILSHHGHNDVLRQGVEVLKTWAKGEKLAPPTTDEYLWVDITCDECTMTPLIGQRYRCQICRNYNLCSTCEKKGHEHPLELVPQLMED